MIIGIAGPTASGKTTVARLLEEKLGAFRIRYSDILEEIAKERGLKTDKPTLQNLFLTEREMRGEDFLAREMEVRGSALPYPILVIEGNRRLVDVHTLRRIAQNKNEKLILLFIDASKETRFTRYNSRLQQNGKEPISAEAFEILEKNGAEDEVLALKEIFKKEGTLIDANTQTPEEIFARVKEVL